MTNITTKPDSLQPEAETSVYLFDNWFDPIEAGLRDRVREFIHTMIEGELNTALSRPRSARHAKPSSEEAVALPMGASGAGCQQDPRSFGHGKPLAIFFCRSVGVDPANASDRRDAMRRPSFTLACGQAHSIERRGDVLVRPATGHAAHYRQRVLTHPCRQLGALPSTPMDCEYDIAHIIVDVGDDVGDQSPQQLLASAHRNARRIPRGRQVSQRGR